MYKKIVLLLALASIINTIPGGAKQPIIEQEAEFAGGEFVSEERREDGTKVRRYKVAEKRQLTEKEILDELECFEEEGNNCYFSKFDKVRWVEQVENVVNGLMEAGKRYEAYFVKVDQKYKFQFIFWRIEDTIYGVLGRRHPRTPLEGSNVSSNPAFQEKMKFYRPLTSNTCFKMLPKGCKYSGQSSEYYQELCIGYDEIAQQLKTDILKVSAVINTESGNNKQKLSKDGQTSSEVSVTLENGEIMNPGIVARDFAKCLSRRVRNNTIQLDCAVKGLPMDHSWAIEKLNTLKRELEMDGMMNVVVDTDSLTLNYDQDLGVVESQKIRVKAEDFIAK